ncbi:conserved hypothetical protein [Histoplasma capsulatum var. duboisii H88]|uniref:Thymidylate kinase n=1 Tax=Ajellomyces capsulatus (strain H88) TaxID=544711 RepID=F0UPC0_AJEC8|nr:conserved hypothetical protein [Histoplasma capsulatum var. duboisii H88]QSS53101.1 hypothetical protein I7I53_00260 [Histoplasma capsulatum var. duboisii H88]
MALTQPVSPPARQPFGVIDPSRLRFLQSAKNQQNGIPTPYLKRRLDTSDLSDTENVDPSAFNTPSAKRARGTGDEDVSKTAPGTVTKFAFVAPPKPSLAKNQRHLQTPLSQINRASSLPNSAPLRAPAGRSPKSKPAKAFSRRSIGSYTRIDPPSFTKTRVASRAPFSIADALHGTLNSLNTRAISTHSTKPQTRTLQSAKSSPLDTNVNINIINSNSSRINRNHPKVWDFEIYTDTEQDEMANLMEHSTCVLDISDDEDKPRNADDRGKENIPPPPLDFAGEQDAAVDDAGVTVAPSAAAVAAAASLSGAADGMVGRNVEMTDEPRPRSALGELDVSRFVAVSEETDEEEQDGNEDACVLNTIDPAAIPLPPPTSQEENCQFQDEKLSESDPGSQSQHLPPSTHNSSPYSPYPHHHHHQQPQPKPSHPILASHAAISALISSTAPQMPSTSTAKNPTPTCSLESSSLPTNEIEIEIWESGSAADEAEAEARGDGVME